MNEFRTGGYCPVCLHDKKNCTCMQTLSNLINKTIMDERLENVNLVNELQETFEDMKTQLASDEKRHGETWKIRGLVYNGMSQEDRFFQKMEEYYLDYCENGTPMPWLKIIGEAHIALVRQKKLSQ